MRSSALSACALLWLAACGASGPTAESENAPAAAAVVTEGGARGAAACSAAADAQFTAAPGRVFEVVGEAQGSDCATALARLTVKKGDVSLVTHELQVSASPALFAQATDPLTLAEALGDWIDDGGSVFASTADLPPWPAGAEAPQDPSEFPVYPAEGVTQARWEELRGQSLPMFCFVQGAESYNCLAVDATDAFIPTAIKTFPG